MSLTTALNIAKSGIAANSEQISVLSRNVARSGESFAARKTANLTTLPNGGVRAASITRASNEAMLGAVLSAKASTASHQAVKTALDQLNTTLNDPELDASPAALIEKLGSALQQFSAAPSDIAAANAAVLKAKDLAVTLNAAAATVQGVRADADLAIADGAGRLNGLLGQFGEVNTRIVKGTQSGADITDALDKRDELLSQISELVGVKTVQGTDNALAIYTDSGVTLFETSARSLSFQPTPVYSAGTVGHALHIDGVPVTGSGAAMPIGSGSLYGLTQVRDTYAVDYQAQLDEAARALITVFAETDQSAAPALPDQAGLFTYAGGPAIPAAGTLVNGVAASIRINNTVDPDQGGNPLLLRDGGMNGAAYVYNATGAAGFTGRLLELGDALRAPLAFDGAAGLSANATVASFASSSAGWLSEARKTVQDRYDYSDTALQRASETLSSATGINIDDEMTRMLEVERSYAASAKLIATIDAMFGALLEAA